MRFSDLTKWMDGAVGSIISVLVLSAGSAYAAECYDEESTDPKAGNAAAVIGPEIGLRHSSDSDYTRPEEGDDVFTGDHVRTGAESHLQVKFCDWSTYTFSPDTEVSISEVYDGEEKPTRVVNFLRGGVRYSSGRDSEPGDTEIEVDESGVTLGVRGTNLIVAEVDGVTYALLEGPLRDNDGLARSGLVEIWETGNERQRQALLRRPGFAVSIGPDGVSRPFRASASLLYNIYRAFTPVIPPDSGSPVGNNLSPRDASQQASFEGDQPSVQAEQRQRQDSDDQRRYPDQPAQSSASFEELAGEAFPVAVGDILPLEVLENFAQTSLTPQGHVLALAPARLFANDGSGETLIDDGVAIIQLTFDFETKQFAPDGLASFVQFDFSLADPTDLSLIDPDFQTIMYALRGDLATSIAQSSNIPFSQGIDGLAVFDTQIFDVTVRRGEDDTVTIDIDAEFISDEENGVVFRAIAGFDSALLQQEAGALSYFSFPLGDLTTASSLDAIGYTGVEVIRGESQEIYSVATAEKVPGIFLSQLDVDFASRTIGGGDSFISLIVPQSSSGITASALDGFSIADYIALDQPVSFDDGLFQRIFIPLADLSDDALITAGQIGLGLTEGGLVGAVSGVFDDGGQGLFAELFLGSTPTPMNALSTLNELETLAAGITGDSYYFAGDGGFAAIETLQGDLFFGDAAAFIRIDFASRTFGGGGSFIKIDFEDAPGGLFQLKEKLVTTAFGDGIGTMALYPLGDISFDGAAITSGALSLRNGDGGDAAGYADLFVTFKDTFGNDGDAEIGDLPLQMLPPLAIGDILPTEALQFFAAVQSSPQSHVLALAPVELYLNGGGGATLQDSGVALLQLEIDWDEQTIAPQVYASFVKVDFSVDDIADLTQADYDFIVPSELEEKFITENKSEFAVAFEQGAGGQAIFNMPLMAVTLRKAGDSDVSLDVAIDYTATLTGGDEYNLTGTLNGLTPVDGHGSLAFFEQDLAGIDSIADLQLYANTGTYTISGTGLDFAQLNGQNQMLAGILYGEIEFDFAKRTLGGGNSFLAYAAAADSGNIADFIPLDRVAAFSDGVFDLALYPLASVSDDQAISHGQLGINSVEELFADLAVILKTPNDTALYAQAQLTEAFTASAGASLSSIGALEDQAIILDGDYRYETTSGDAFLISAFDDFFVGSASLSLDVNFATRTIGGGNSNIAISLSDIESSAVLDISSFIAQQFFADAIEGQGLFAFDADDFVDLAGTGGPGIDAALLLLRDGTSLGAGEFADMLVRFNDGSGGVGEASLTDMTLINGATP